LANGFVIFHHQNRLRAALQRIQDASGRSCAALAFNLRKVDFDRSADSWLAVDGDVTLTLLDNSVDRGQAKSRAPSGFLGCEKWFKEFCLYFVTHPTTGVTNGEHDIRAGDKARLRASISFIQVDIGGLDGKLAAAGHGITGVDDEV